MPAQHIYKPNQTRAGFLLAEKEGLVWNYAGKAFNKMFFMPPICLLKNTIVPKPIAYPANMKHGYKYNSQIGIL